MLLLVLQSNTHKRDGCMFENLATREVIVLMSIPAIIFLIMLGKWWVKNEKQHVSETETLVGLVVKIDHSNTRVSRYTQLWLQLRDGEIKELDLNSSDVPEILNLQIGQIATVTFYPVLIGQKLTKLSFENRIKEAI